MKAIELLEKNPESAKLVIDWFFSKMIESLNGSSVDEEFRNFMREQALDNDKMGVMIDANPRMLFDVFDANEIFISINVVDRKFTYRIDNLVNPTEYSTRKECELISITRAFEILENKLSPKEEEIN
jgi:hypothetical protein